ncbi:MAG: hypothetical protein JW731_16800 [Bacteroidales bacterium]|nr:hypothetical protein [Bacteroidales bacterium]
MKRKDKRYNIIFLIVWNLVLIGLIFLIQSKSFGQYHKPPSFWSKLAKDWSLGVNAGQTAFFGDVSLYDDELSEKLSKEGAWAYGVSLNRQITPVIGLSGQLLVGKLEGSNSRSKFVADIMDYSVNLTLNFVNLLLPDNDAHFFLYGKLGMGQFQFESRLMYDDPDKQDLLVQPESPEFLYLIGGGASYIINHAFDVNFDGTARMVNNDRLDGTSNKKDKDYYSYISLGFTYKINNRPRDTRYYKKLGMKSPLIRRYKN